MFKKDKFDSSISMYEPAHLTKRIFFLVFKLHSTFGTAQPKIVRQRTRSYFVGINFERIIFLARLEKSILVPLCVFYCWQQRHLHPLFFFLVSLITEWIVPESQGFFRAKIGLRAGVPKLSERRLLLLLEYKNIKKTIIPFSMCLASHS